MTEVHAASRRGGLAGSGTSAKSWKVHIDDSLVTMGVTWPHGVVDATDGKAAVYKILMQLFVQGNFIVIEEEKEAVRTWMTMHLKDLMVDSQLYGWEKAQPFHMVWLYQFEQGQMTWDDKLGFFPSPSLALGYHYHFYCKQNRRAFTYNAPAKTSTRACQAFNQGLCMDGSTHPRDMHLCSHCLEVVNRTFPHQEQHCKRKHPGYTPLIDNIMDLYDSNPAYLMNIDMDISLFLEASACCGGSLRAQSWALFFSDAAACGGGSPGLQFRSPPLHSKHRRT